MKFKLLLLPLMILISTSVFADTPSGNNIQDAVQNTATGIASGIVNVVNEDAANYIKEYANQPDSAAVATGQGIGGTIAYGGIGGGAIVYSVTKVATSVEIAMQAVTKASKLSSMRSIQGVK